MDYDEIYNRIQKNDSIEDIVRDYNIKVEGQGNNRIVFRINENEVLKIPKVNLKKQNKLEIKQWNNKPSLRKYFAKIEDYSDECNWILMSRCKNISEEEAEEFYTKLEEKDIYPTDNNKNNVGFELKRERYVLLDYGFRVEIR